MKLIFHLAWLKGGKSLSSAFKNPAFSSICSEYLKRLRKFSSCEISGGLPRSDSRGPRDLFVFCDIGRSKRKRPPLIVPSSEELSKLLETWQGRSLNTIHVVIGAADGYADSYLESFSGDDLRWSFGPMTLPHELAAVIALEQIYRAFSILNRHPYHCGHE